MQRKRVVGMFSRLTLLACSLAISLASLSAGHAQIPVGQAQTSSDQTQTSSREILDQVPNNTPRATTREGQATQAEGGPTAGMAIGRMQPMEADRPQAFGASLFSGPPATSSGAANANYRIQPGDQIAVQAWGGATAQSVSTVDPDGNIFLPQAGVLHVGGVREGDLQETVQRQASKTFTSNVNIYAVLLTAHKVGVFVTGFVVHPGRYTGEAPDSVLDYLVRAGGVDPSRGSYRTVTIKRNDEVVAKIDLYQFLITGVLPSINLQEGDTVVVGAQGSMIAVDGAVRNNYLFEVAPGPDAGRDIVMLARPLPSVTHAVLRGTRNNEPYSAYLRLDDFSRTQLFDQDQVTFVTDAPPRTVRVRIQGSRIGPSVFVVPDTTTLSELLPQIRVEPALADVASVYVLRKTVAEQQTRVIGEARDRLERSLFLANSATAGVSQIRASEAQLIANYIQRSRSVQPEGRLVVSDGRGTVADLRLEDDDVIVIPKKTQLVLVSGEVLAPQSVLYQPGLKIEGYVDSVGGYSERGRRGHYLIKRANGAIILDKDAKIEPGDELVILPYVDPKSFQLVSDVMSLVYQVAVSANVFTLLK